MPSIEELTELSDSDRLAIKKSCLRHLFVFAKTVMGYDDIIESVHGELCRFLSSPTLRKQVTYPRSFVKTWLGTIAYSVWIALPRTAPDEFPPQAITTTPPQFDTPQDGNSVAPATAEQPYPTSAFVPLEGYPGYWVDPIFLLGPNVRVLVASYVIGNAMKMIGLIRKTYEKNVAMQILFAEVIPESFNKVKWSDTEACIARTENFTESTFEAGGIGGSTTSRHYDMIIEDDLIYANKDDFTGQELQPSQEDIDKAIGWHKLAMSLLVPGTHTRIHNIGTRWAKHDLVDYIRTNEKDYAVLEKAITVDGTPNGEPSWPTMYPSDQIRRIYQAQGPYMFATQYLCKPMAPEDMLFKMEWLAYYRSSDEIPKEIRIFTTTDLSLWGKSVKKGVNSRGVVMTCGWDSKNHVYLLRYDVARFDPSEIMDLWYIHHKLFKPEIIGVEEVYYQKAILHFMRIRMEKDGWLPVRALKTSTQVDKDVRIRALQPYALNGAIHCRPDHKDFILEYGEYVPGSDHCRKDILDALAYQLQVARPGVIEESPKNRLKELKDYTFKTDMDAVMDNMWLAGKNKGPFAHLEISENQHLKEEEELDFERVLNGLPGIND